MLLFISLSVRRLWIVIAVTVLGACATYGDWVGDMEQYIARDQPGKALAVLDDRHQPRRDAVLTLLNRAMLLRMDGQFAQSNAAFEAAKSLIEQLSAVSVSEQTGALTINDTLRSYTGDPYEQVLLHVYEALNYIQLGELDSARVEALQLDVKLNQLADDGFHEDAFARYLSGMIYEGLHEWDDAMIAYRKSYELYRQYPPRLAMTVPDFLKQDLVRNARRLGLTDELKQYEHDFGQSAGAARKQDGHDGELIFFLHSGLAPVKHEVISSAITESGKMVSIAMPVYISRQPHVVAARLLIDDRQVTTQLGENINTLAIESLDKQTPAIMARAIARAVVKSKAVSETRKNDDSLGFLVNVAGVISERADTRSWSTLPNQIGLARLALPAGQYRMVVELLDAGGDIVQRKEYNNIDIRAGEEQFLSLHKVLPADLIVPESLPYRRRRH